MSFLQPFSENPQDRMTGRAIRSLHMLGDISGKKILNIGTLGGWFENHVMELGGYEKLVGIDLPWTHIQELQKKYRERSDIEFIEGSILELPFEKNSFDVIAMWEVLEHLPKEKELFAFMEIDRVLRKNGVLLLSTPYADIRARLFDPFWYFWHRHYTKTDIEWLLREWWFFDYTTEVSGWWYELVTMIFFYFFKHLFRSEIPGKSFFERKRKEEFERKGFTNIFVRAVKNMDS